MSRRAFRIITVVAALILLGGMTWADEQTREFAVSAGGTLELNLEAGGSVVVRGDGGSKITVTYEIDQNSTIEFRESSSGLEIVTDYKSRGRSQSSSVDIEVHVPAHFDIELDSMGGGLTVEGVDGNFRGKTMGDDGRPGPVRERRRGRHGLFDGRQRPIQERRAPRWRPRHAATPG